jgi:DNA recombination protein RmuC
MIQPILYILTGLSSGVLLGYLVNKYFLQKTLVQKSTWEQLIQENSRLKMESAASITRRELSENFVSRDLHEMIHSSFLEIKTELEKERKLNQENQSSILHLTVASEQKINKSDIDKEFISREYYGLIKNKLESAETELAKKQETILALNNQLTELAQKELFLHEKLSTFQKEWEGLQARSQQEFKNLAAEIMDEKRKAFLEANRSELNHILDPFKAGMREFRDKVEATRKEDIADMTSLKKEIENLEKLNYQLSDDARNLASALKAEVKMQGNWGEDRLNMILEVEGLEKYIDYSREEQYRDEQQDQNRRPDFILKLPDGKHIIIDSKVSLTAYINYFNATSQEEKASYLRQHLRSVSDHIDSLADKNYQSLAGLHTPDYVFMFMPVESALTLALNQNPEIFNHAIKRKIVLITPTTLVATLKVIKILWQKENQVKNVEEIFRQCGELYDKFVIFLDQMEGIEAGLQTALQAYKNAMYSLTEGTKKGHTIIGRFEAIRKLEAKTDKRIKDKYLKEIEFLDDASNLKVIEDKTTEE